MTSKLTIEQTQQIIDAADAVITALAGTNDEVHKDDTDKMVRLWDDLNDRYAPPEVVRELARMALAAMDSEPVGWTWHYREQWHVTNDKCRAEFVAKDGDVAVLPLYRHAQPAPANEPITVTDDMAYAFHHALTDSMLGADEVEEIKTGLRVVFANLTAPIVSAKYPERLPCSVLLEPGLRFGKGIKTSTMLAALARRAIYESDMAALSPEEKAEFRQKIADFKALIAQPAPVVPEKATVGEMPFLGASEGVYVRGWNDCRAAMLQAGSDEIGSWGNGKYPPSDKPAPIDHGYRPGCECSGCKAMGRICAELAGWIPVSERMPEKNGTYQVWNGKHVGAVPFLFGSFQCLNPDQVTHWMPTAKPQQEVQP